MPFRVVKYWYLWGEKALSKNHTLNMGEKRRDVESANYHILNFTGTYLMPPNLNWLWFVMSFYQY